MNEDKRIEQACKILLNHMVEGGQFTTASFSSASKTMDCVQGNLCWSLVEMGRDDPRLDKA